MSKPSPYLNSIETNGATTLSVRIALLVLSLLFISGLIGIHFFIAYEKNRDLIIWQDKLSYSAQAEKQSIDSWLQTLQSGLLDITENKTLKLYLSMLQDPLVKMSYGEQRNYKRYLKEVLMVKALELGFSNYDKNDLQLNQPMKVKNGMMLIAPDAHLLVSPDAVIKLPNDIIQAIKNGQYIKEFQIQELITTDDQQLRLVFILPIYPPQVSLDESNPKIIAYLIAVKDVSTVFRKILKNHLGTQQQEEVNLLSENGDKILYLLSINQELPSIKRQLSANTPELAAASAFYNTGHFQEKINHRGQDVLLFSVRLHNIPWVLMHSVIKSDALAEFDYHANTLYIIFCITFILLVIVLILILRHSVSLRYQSELNKLQLINTELNTQNQLLQTVTDNLGVYVMLLDNEHRLTYGNKALANLTGQQDTALTGQNLSMVLGNNTAKCLQDAMNSRLHEDQIIAIDDRSGSIMQTSYIPLKEEGKELSMIVATDISASIAIEKQKEKIMGQAVQMLTKILEQHDSYSSQHSVRVKHVVLLIGKDLGKDETELFNLAISASLINIGKFYVPKKILLKQERLTGEEQSIMQEHIKHTIRLLKEIDMDNIIIQAVSQSYERIDGSGYPNQLQGENINLFARILAVANSFIAMIYPRPWRKSMGQIEALDILMTDVGYDKKIVIALYNIIENKGEITL